MPFWNCCHTISFETQTRGVSYLIWGMITASIWCPSLLFPSQEPEGRFSCFWSGDHSVCPKRDRFILLVLICHHCSCSCFKPSRTVLWRSRLAFFILFLFVLKRTAAILILFVSPWFFLPGQAYSLQPQTNLSCCGIFFSIGPIIYWTQLQRWVQYLGELTVKWAHTTVTLSLVSRVVMTGESSQLSEPSELTAKWALCRVRQLLDLAPVYKHPDQRWGIFEAGKTSFPYRKLSLFTGFLRPTSLLSILNSVPTVERQLSLVYCSRSNEIK